MSSDSILQLISAIDTKEGIYVANFRDKTVRVVIKPNSIWFCAKDVCTVLGLANSSQAISSLCEDEKLGIMLNDPQGRTQETACISESGLYALIFKSKKQEAKSFRKWITSEILPSIRKTGSYSTSQLSLDSNTVVPGHNQISTTSPLNILVITVNALMDSFERSVSLNKFAGKNVVYVAWIGEIGNDRVYFNYGHTARIDERGNDPDKKHFKIWKPIIV